MTKSQSPVITRRAMTTRETRNIHGRHLPHPMRFHEFEFAVYAQLKAICRDYTGGCWKFYVLSNGAWFMAPKDKARFTLQDVYGNDHSMSAEGAGLAVVIYLLNHMSWTFHHHGQKEKCDSAVAHHDALLAYVYQGKDADAVLAVLD